ncbi:MAG TPA: response regulator [Chitinophagaceae bacterium]|nr:response regulator [Chitinophagaceae bacterium]
MRKTLLIVDDDPDDVQLFCEAVHEVDKSFLCPTAHSGEEALQLLKDALIKPDFIFLDLNMPRMGGKQFLALLKKDPQFAKIPVIIYTTSKTKKDLEDSIRLGAASFLTKPSKFENLVKAISYVLSGDWERISKLQ